MQQVESLTKQWNERGRFDRIRAVMELTEAGLMLGAGTLIARLKTDGRGSSVLDFEGQEDRVLVLLSIAFGRSVPARLIGNLRRASRQWAQSNKALVQIQITLAGSPQFIDMEDAFLLFLADGLIAAGISPRALMKAQGLDPTPLDSFKLIEHRQAGAPAKEGERSLVQSRF